MKGRAVRRHLASKKAKKRWDFYHGTFIMPSNMQGSLPAIGVYRKRKGCECRLCSFMHQKQKMERNEKLRTDAKLDHIIKSLVME